MIRMQKDFKRGANSVKKKIFFSKQIFFPNGDPLKDF